METDDVLVVVGGGHAGVELAFSSRTAGWEGRIVLISDEPDLPYQRPPLSKAYLSGAVQADGLALKSPEAYAKARVDLLLGCPVVELDRAAARARLADGSSVPYARLAMVTGGRARPLPAAAEGADRTVNFHYLRTRADVERIRTRFAPGARLVIIGAGYVGLEVAAVAVRSGLQVVVLEAAPRVLARVTAPVVSAFYERVHRAAGVDLRTQVQVSGFEISADAVTHVVCQDGERLEADLVVAGIGLLPNTELAQAAGLAVDDGIQVDASCRTSDPLVVAAGDCARFHSDLYQRSIRLESVPNALEQARCAASTVAGAACTYDCLPWFWSDQYDLKLKMVGLSQGYDRVVLRGSVDQSSFSAFYLQGDRVLAVDTVNRVPDFMLAKRLVGEQIRVDAERLADEAIALKSCLPVR